MYCNLDTSQRKQATFRVWGKRPGYPVHGWMGSAETEAPSGKHAGWGLKLACREYQRETASNCSLEGQVCCADSCSLLCRQQRVVQTAVCCADSSLLCRQQCVVQTAVCCADSSLLCRQQCVVQTAVCCADSSLLCRQQCVVQTAAVCLVTGLSRLSRTKTHKVYTKRRLHPKYVQLQ